MEYILGIAFVAVVAYLLVGKKKDSTPTQLEIEVKAVEPAPAVVVEPVVAPEVETAPAKKPAAKKAPAAKKTAAKKTTSKKA
jgi:topoisomerase IA-like protein